MADAISACVHCGFCLAACPTYRVLGEETDSPRGRIVLMKQVLEGDLAVRDAMPHIDRCLGCLACESACPSGVRYRDLLIPFRGRMLNPAVGPATRTWRRLLLRTLESPRLFRRAFVAARLSRAMGSWLPAGFRAMTALLPERLPDRETPDEVTPAIGHRRGRVALLEGCVQSVLKPSINRAARRFLAANGVEVITPRDQGCCGALALHVGFADHARELAARNARRFAADVDVILTTAAGCGSAMKDMATGGAEVRDIAEFIAALGVRTPLRATRPTRVAYQDACHLTHGQGVRSAPRQLLSRIDDLTLVEVGDGDLCCGSAGLYNLEHPDTARTLGRLKAGAIRGAAADVVATGNIGCLTQMEAHLAGVTPAIGVRHTIELLDWARGASG